MKVAVLGCGPTGLIAAHAAWSIFGDVTIYSKNRKSHMFGAQYLHQPIPGIPADKVRIEYELVGSIEEYRRKVYGPDWDGAVSPGELEASHDGWDIRSTYDSLWDLYGSSVVEADITPAWLVGTLPRNFDFIFSTIPTQPLCLFNHTFASQTVWAMGDSDEQQVPVNCTDNTVVCNGAEVPTWYRASNIFGYKTVEWPELIRPPYRVAQVAKPLWNNCFCFPDLIRLGRYGMWQKGVLSHMAFDHVIEVMTGQLSAVDFKPHPHPCPYAVDSGYTRDAAEQMGCHCNVD